ncbi:hypothetical protein BJV78DRAFT_433609 [Lactifluus subvellereus]|nr:hypothetical protein BJV78DRAFT_433609 [Lactifluus subvellereus]
MLAAISPPSHNISQSIPYTHSPTRGSTLLDPVSPVENKVCPGCHLTLMDDRDGVAVAFGQSFFHVDCFKCAKCHDKVTADTNLLLLSDGQPVCSNCSYSCSLCHQPILDEAIMTGDDSYHAHCFKCRSCHNRIDELMFAKTSHGIYCMSCHHQRVARSRRHAQKQKERTSGPSSTPSNSHGRPAKEQMGLSRNTPTGRFAPDSAPVAPPSSATPVPAQASPARPKHATPYESRDNHQPEVQISQSGRQSGQLECDERRSAPHTPTALLPSPRQTSRNLLPSPTSPSVSPHADSAGPSSPAIVVPPEVPEAGPQVALSSPQRETSDERGNARSFLSPDLPMSLEPEHSKSYNEGTRPLNVLLKSDAPPPGSSLSVRVSGRAGKRNSINPAMSFNYETFATESSNKSSSAPQSPLCSVLPMPDTSRALTHTDVQPPPLREQASVGLSRQLSRKSHTEPLSPSAAPGSMLSRSHSQKESSFRPPLHQNMVLERLPPRTHSLNASIQDPKLLTRRPSTANSTSGRKSSDEKDRSKPGSSLSIDVEKSRAGYGKRPMSPAYKAASPAHKVDVPHGIESGTDTSDGERELSTDERNQLSPLPSKEKEAKSRRRPLEPELDAKRPTSPEVSREVSFISSAGDADSEDESSPVERVSRSTFIAPAHPPIRFSISANGFQELLSLVDPRNRSSLQGIEELVKLNEDAAMRLDASLNPDVDATQNEGRRSSTPASNATPTTFGYSSPADNSSVTTISAPSSQGHDDSFVMLDSPGGAASDLLQRQRSIRNAVPTSSRSSSELSHGAPTSDGRRVRLDSNSSHQIGAGSPEPGAHITVTAPDLSVPRSAKLDPSHAVIKRLQDALQDSGRRGTTQITLDQEFVQAIVMMVEQRRDENVQMKGKLNHIKRASRQAMNGLTVAQSEYEAELKARRDAEAEVTRLRVLLSGQAARITALSGQGRKDELHKQLTRELSDSLNVLEHDVSTLKVERDVALVEMEEIAASRRCAAVPDRETATLSRSLSTRLDNLKAQYRGELVSLTDEREALLREIAELQSTRDVFLEETTMLSARNEELAQLNAHYMRRIEAASSESPMAGREKLSLEHQRSVSNFQPANGSFRASTDESVDSNSTRYAKGQKPSSSDVTLRVFKWRGHNRDASPATSQALDSVSEKSLFKHTFQQVSVLRFTKCDHCGEKLWGFQARCQTCNISVHPRCQQHVQVICSPQISRRDDGAAMSSLHPSIFGRELTEQVRADSKLTDRMVPLIVEKCIAAVDATALDYEGIYRKTGGSGQSKMITQLFERGDYTSFDLLDCERFNDICSVTSVLKTYFRSLPNPLLTFVLHDEFIFASTIQDPIHKSGKYADLVKQLPTEHYYTLRTLMLHLHRIQEHHDQNLMTARNLGVVFGRTCCLFRSLGVAYSSPARSYVNALSQSWSRV